MSLKATRRLCVLVVGSTLVAAMPAAMALSLQSPAFSDGQTIPSRYTCDGTGLSPALNFADVPEGTQSLALLVEDPDAPGGNWVHWLVYDLSPDTHELAGASTPDNLPPEATTVKNSFGDLGYGGMCPPTGQRHRYVFRLFALDNHLQNHLNSLAAVRHAMKGHILTTARLTGRYRRPQ